MSLNRPIDKCTLRRARRLDGAMVTGARLEDVSLNEAEKRAWERAKIDGTIPLPPAGSPGRHRPKTTATVVLVLALTALAIIALWPMSTSLRALSS